MKGLCSKLLRKKQNNLFTVKVEYFLSTSAPLHVSSLYFLHDTFHLFRHLAPVPCETPPQQHFLCNFLRKHWAVYMTSGFSFWFSLMWLCKAIRVSQTSEFSSVGLQHTSLQAADEITELMLVAQSCLILCDPMDCSLRGSSVHGIFQARMLEWVVRGSSQPRD